MKEIILTNFAPCFPDPDTIDPQTGIATEFLFTPYVSVKEVEGNPYREVYWKCNTCNERATQATREGVIPEIVLSCACRENYSYGLDFAMDMTTAASVIPLEAFND